MKVKIAAHVKVFNAEPIAHVIGLLEHDSDNDLYSEEIVNSIEYIIETVLENLPAHAALQLLYIMKEKSQDMQGSTSNTFNFDHWRRQWKKEAREFCLATKIEKEITAKLILAVEKEYHDYGDVKYVRGFEDHREIYLRKQAGIIEPEWLPNFSEAMPRILSGDIHIHGIGPVLLRRLKKQVEGL